MKLSFLLEHFFHKAMLLVKVKVCHPGGLAALWAHMCLSPQGMEAEPRKQQTTSWSAARGSHGALGSRSEVSERQLMELEKTEGVAVVKTAGCHVDLGSSFSQDLKGTAKDASSKAALKTRAVQQHPWKWPSMHGSGLFL